MVMTAEDFKVTFLNATALGVSLSTIETALQITLLIISIVYTAQRWHLMYKKKDND